MNIPYESLKQLLGLKILSMRIQIRDLYDPGSGMENSGTGINTPYPQHWIQYRPAFFIPIQNFDIVDILPYAVFVFFPLLANVLPTDITV
jgi:hypothetical protein